MRQASSRLGCDQPCTSYAQSPASHRPCLRAAGPASAPQRRLPVATQAATFVGGQQAGGLGITEYVWVLSLGAAAIWLGKSLFEQGKQEPEGPPCPSCNGTGKVDCICQRWSDGDVGCGTCGGSGFATCSNCGGGGTAQPSVQRIYVRANKTVAATPDPPQRFQFQKPAAASKGPRQKWNWVASQRRFSSEPAASPAPDVRCSSPAAVAAVAA